MNIRNKKKRIWFKISPIIYNVSPVLASKIVFLFAMNKRLDLKNPKTFNEKIQWLKLYWQDPRVAMCADKYELREYVRECDAKEILNPIFGVYKNFDHINFELLPDKFALKCTHGSGYNIICENKDDFNIYEVKKKVNKWMNSRFSYIGAEIQYDKMEPKIIIEKYIEGIDKHPPIDYKMFCFNGKVCLTMTCEGRGE